MTRRKTFSGGSQATFNRGCHNELHDFAINLGGNGSSKRGALLAVQRETAALASNCQRRFASDAICRMLQECQRAMLVNFYGGVGNVTL